LEALEERWCPTGGIMEWADPTGNSANAVAAQADGKIVSVGQVRIIHNNNITYAMQVVRWNPSGTLDTTFNGTGTVTINFGLGSGVNTATAVAIQPDGKILVGGKGATQQTGTEYVVARLNTNGSLDTTFGNSGPRGASNGIWAYSVSNAAPVYLAVLTDSSSHLTGIMVGGQRGGVFEAIKLTPAGKQDTTFGVSGDAVFNVGGVQVVGGMAVTPSGGVVMVGSGYGNNGVVLALTSSGQLDTTFNGTGYRVDNFGTSGSPVTEFDGVAVQPTGGGAYRIVVGGRAFVGGPNSSGLVVAYTSSGQLDTTFATGGVFTTAAAGDFSRVALEADGSIVVVGYAYYTNPDGSLSTQGVVGHLYAGGTVDTSFGTSGNGFSLLPEYDGPLQGLAIDSLGQIVVAYTSNGQAYVALLTAP
jgi:uncharacterized delta-60 repeat protein